MFTYFLPPLKTVLFTICLCVALLSAIFSGMWFVFDYLPDQAEIIDGYKYKRIQQLIEGDDAKHYLPTIKKAMKNGKFQLFEYKQLMKIEDKLNYMKEYKAFLESWNTIKKGMT